MLVQEIDGIFDWREVGDGDEARVGDLRISFSRTDHPPVTHAVRVEGAGGALGYSAAPGPVGPWRLWGRGSTSHCARRPTRTTSRERQDT